MPHHHNPQIKRLNFKFTKEGESLTIDISNTNHLTGIHKKFAHYSPEHLQTGIWQSRVLDSMPLVELRAKDTKIKDLKPFFKIKTLKTIYIDSKKASKNQKNPK